VKGTSLAKKRGVAVVSVYLSLIRMTVRADSI
jgi:hypothetical protein